MKELEAEFVRFQRDVDDAGDSEGEDDIASARPIVIVARQYTDAPVRKSAMQGSLLVKYSALDDWIDIYVAEKEPPRPRSNAVDHGAVRASIELFDGKALGWFKWIDLFYVLVYATGKSPCEKLGLLARSLVGECSSVVYGMGGGDEAYKDALSTLKRVYGRYVMLASNYISLDIVDLGQIGDTDPLLSFRQFCLNVHG